MKCPHCYNDIKLPERAYKNADSYNNPCVVRTECCLSLIRLTPIRTYAVTQYEGTDKTDDWGA